MTNRSIRQFLIIALTTTLTGTAFARQPPALVKAQQAAAHATQSGGGYRDISWRFGTVAARAPEVMRAAGGYRDIHYRFEAAYRTATRNTTSRWR